MKIKSLVLAIFTGLSLHAASKNASAEKTHKKRTVTFINEDTASGVDLTISYANGKRIGSKNLSAKESVISKVPFIGNRHVFHLTEEMHGQGLHIEAKETSGDRIETGPYSLHLRKQNDTGTVRIVRRETIVKGNPELVFVGNEEQDPEGAFVRKLVLTPGYKKKAAKEAKAKA